MDNSINIWAFMAGLGLFLLGMYMLEQGLQGLSSKAMKQFLLEQTRSPIRGVITGTVATAILQSSTLVGLIVLAFVGAGILDLRSALGVILGSNLGTTFKGWIVTFIGFQLDMVELSQPIVAVGALAIVFLQQNSKSYYYGNLLLGLGLLLMGLGEMTGGFSSLAGNIDLSILHGHNLLVYFIGGALFTAVVQSSSATMMIILSAMDAGIFSLAEAAPMAIGADLGTTSTVLLGTLKGSLEKRRVALSHFFFNIATALMALLMLSPLLQFITRTMKINDPLYSLVAFHSLFNVIGIILFIPWVNQFIRFLHWLVPDREIEGDLGIHLKRVPPGITEAAIEAAIEAARKDIFSQLIHTIKLNLRCFKLNPAQVFPDNLQEYLGGHHRYEDDYARLKRASGEFLGYTYTVQTHSRDENDLHELSRLNHAIRNVSYAAKFIKDIRHNLLEFRHASSEIVQFQKTELHKWAAEIYHALLTLMNNRNPELAEENFEHVKQDLRSRYELFQQNIYRASGENRIDDEETSSLLNVNRAIYLSTSALLEAIGVLLRIDKE